MYRKPDHYYIAYGFEGETPRSEDFVMGRRNKRVLNDFEDYATALKCAKLDHHKEIRIRKQGHHWLMDDEIMVSYVMKVSEKCEDTEVARISGWDSEITEWEEV